MKRFARIYWNLLAPPRITTALTLGMTLCALLFIFAGLRGVATFMRDMGAARSDRRQDARDAAHQSNVNAAVEEAGAHEQNADQFSAARRTSEARVRDQKARKLAASRQAAATHEPTRKARSRYEEARRRAADDVPAVSDERICSELAARHINAAACR